jgi:hypothetical protein
MAFLLRGMTVASIAFVVTLGGISVIVVVDGHLSRLIGK